MRRAFAFPLLVVSVRSFQRSYRSSSAPRRSQLHSLFEDNGPRFRGEIASEYVPLDDLMDPLICDADFPCDNGDVAPRFTADDFWCVIGMPSIAPFFAFFTFEGTSQAYQSLVNFLSTRSWVAVDGGELQNRLLVPTINGLVVPAVALLFATMTSTTITTLRQRQVEVRRSINMEAGELRTMECLIDSIQEGPVQDKCRDYLIQYTGRVLSECHPRVGAGNDLINARRSFDSELNGFLRCLHSEHGTTIPSHIANECYETTARLREQRVNRITALQSVYPELHYAILFALALAECVAFIMETDQSVLVFLNSFQLKILWSMLVGTFVACFAVFRDLRNPFSGSYQISASVDQLHTIKMTLQASRQISMQKRPVMVKNKNAVENCDTVDGAHINKEMMRLWNESNPS